MKKKFIIVVLILFLSSILFSQTLPEKIVVGYWHNWGYTPNTVYLTEIPEAYDVINIAFATPTVAFGSTMEFIPDSGIYPNVNDFINDIILLQSLNKKVVISIGGANHPVSLLTADDVQEFVITMSAIIDTYGFDGIDIDLEGGSISLETGDNDFRYPTTPKIVNLIDAITQLANLYPYMMLTTAPETAYVQGGYGTYAGIWGAYLPLIHALRDRWTYVHVQHYNTGSMFGRDGVSYNPPFADFHVAMADMLLAGFNVNVYVNNIFFEPLLAEQVAIGLPASISAAGSGYTTPDVVHTALDYLILGIPFGGQYQLANPDGYADYRGLMTWSINWDLNNNLEFSNAHRPYLDDLIGVPVSEEEIPANEISISHYPNPFNPTTTISFSLPAGSDDETKLIIYNLKGQKMKTFPVLMSGVEGSGIYSVVWNGTDDSNNPVSSGVYFYKLNSGNTEVSNKMLLLK
jgi:chitinase